jgi:neutral ceramidase
VIDPLHSKDMAIEESGNEIIIIACDLIGYTRQIVDDVKAYILELTGAQRDSVMLTATHTHSGPTTISIIGCGEPDQRYIARLAGKIAESALQAHNNLTEATMSFAEVKAEKISFNRVYGEAGSIDNKASVIKFSSGDKMLGFISHYSAHPVVCCEATNKIHGDFVGIASNMIAKKDNSVGIFLQGACGDINPIYCHQPEDISIANLNKHANSYANIIMQGLNGAKPLKVDSVKAIGRVICLEQQIPDRIELEQRIANGKEILRKKDISESEEQQATYQVNSGLAMMEKLDRNDPPQSEIYLQAIKIGDIVIISHPFELFNSAKKRLEQELSPAKVLVVGYADELRGYAPTEDRYELDGKDGRGLCYAAYFVPFMLRDYPFKPDLVETLIDEMKKLYYDVIV